MEIKRNWTKIFHVLFSFSYRFCNRLLGQIPPFIAAYSTYSTVLSTPAKHQWCKHQSRYWIWIFLAGKFNLPQSVSGLIITHAGVYWESTRRYSNTRDSMTQIVLLLRSSFSPCLSDREEVTRQFVLLWLPTAAALMVPVASLQRFSSAAVRRFFASLFFFFNSADALTVQKLTRVPESPESIGRTNTALLSRQANCSTNP